MNTRPFRTHARRTLAGSLACLALLLPAPAAAQSLDEVQDELARTRAELDTAHELIATLRDEIARLQAELRELRGEDGPDPLADLPTDPLACPDSMTVELARRYQTDLAHLPTDEQTFPQAAEAWAERMRREIRGRREWLLSIDLLEPLEGSRDHLARIRVYDPVTLLPLGEADLTTVPGRFVSRIEAEPDTPLWLLAAEVSADPAFNPDRRTRGAFDAPPFVGPYIESGYRLDWTGLTASDVTPATSPPAAPERPALPQPPPPGRDR